MAATLQHQHQPQPTTTSSPSTGVNGTGVGGVVNAKTPQLKRIVYSKYRELLGSYNDKANAIIDTLPAYMVHEDRGFNFVESLDNAKARENANEREMYGQRGSGAGGGGGYEAPACVQNAMMTKDKKPFTYTPGGIDLSQIKSERMAKRLARNAQAEGATGASQQNRPTQPTSPGSGGSPSAAMGAAAMGMPFQVLPPPPPPPQPGAAGKKPFNGNPAPPPPPPQSTLAPPGGNGGNTSAPNSPSMARKSPTPQRFEPPPMGFRPEIKIPPNPMAALRKVPPPVEKNTFWKDEYVKERSKSPMPETSVNGSGNGEQDNRGAGNDVVDAPRKAAAPVLPPPQQHQQQHHQQLPEQQSYSNYAPYTPTVPSPPTPAQQQQQQQEQQPMSPRPEFRSVPVPQSPAVNVYTRQANSPLQQQQQRSTESPFRYAQQQQEVQRTPISPLAAQQTSSPPVAAPSVQPQSNTVPWRTQRNQQQPGSQAQQQTNAPPQRSRDVFSPGPGTATTEQQNYSTQPQYQGAKPTNIGSLYIAPLSAPPNEPQAQHFVRQQQPARDSPMRQIQPQQQQQQQQLPQQQLGWLRSQPAAKEQAPWARAEENGNVLPSSLRAGSVPPQQQQQQQQQRQQYYQPPPQDVAPPSNQVSYQAPSSGQQGRGYSQAPQNFGAHGAHPVGGLRLQINANSSAPTPTSAATNQSGPKERIIPITLEQTPTYAAAQPNFGAPAGHIIRSANQFVDQGYNNYPAQQQAQWNQQQQQQQQQQQHHQQQQQWIEPNMQRILLPNQPQASGTRIIPITLESKHGGPISASPVVLQNGHYNLYVHECPLEAEIRYRKNRLSDLRSPPIQSKSFRILQKITDTVDDGNDGKNNSSNSKNNVNGSNCNGNKYELSNINGNLHDGQDTPAQLQRPQYARQMSAQQAHRNSPNCEQMRRMQLQSNNSNGPEQQGNGSAQSNRYVQQRSPYDMPQQYVPPSEQQVPEPKKYTGSAIPSRSFKILQAMTTPENADHKVNAELDSDLENIELNEIHKNNKNNNQSNNIHNNNKNKNSSSEINYKQNVYIDHQSSPTPTPPPTSSSTASNIYSSNSSLNSDSSCQPVPRAQSVPPHYPYAYPYAYPWYPPPPPPTTGVNGEIPQMPPHMMNWPYPYPYPPPNAHQTEDNVNNPSAYPPYPYYYPYYPPPPPPYGQAPVPPMPSNGDSNSASNATGYPTFVPPYPYPYPVAPSYSQSSNSSRASSVLPDIIITPSTDDVPSKVILQHHIKMEKPTRRAHSVEIEEVASRSSFQNHIPPRGEVIDMLSERLANIHKIGGVSNLSQENKKAYAGEQLKQFGTRSPSENSSPVQITAVMTESDTDDDSSDDDTETAPRNEGKMAPLQAIKSVTNVQVYKGLGQALMENAENSAENNNEDDDVTTADGESDVFDEEDDDEETAEELELDECIEETDNDTFIVEDNLSVIYEEESDMERSSDYARTVIKRDGSSVSDATIGDRIVEDVDDDNDLDNQIEENDDKDEDEESNSVTVRLPLKFSFSHDDKIATVEVGNSQIEERRGSLNLENKRNSSNIANIEDTSDHESDDDSCEASVSISLAESVEKDAQPYKSSRAYPIEDMKLPETDNDASSPLTLNMRNKFLNETIKNDVTNNIAKEEEPVQPVQVVSEPIEELDFFATLRATKLQAQQMMEKSQTYWGKSMEKKDADVKDATVEAKADAESAKEESEKSNEKSQKALEAARNSFWSTFATATKEPEVQPEPEEESEEIDFWASIEQSKEDNEWKQKKQTVTQTHMVREEMKQVEFWTTTLRSHVAAMPQAQKAEISFAVEEKSEVGQDDDNDDDEEEEEDDFWTAREKSSLIVKSESPAVKEEKEDEEEEKDFWASREKSNFDVKTKPEKEKENEDDFWASREKSNMVVTANPEVKEDEEEVDFWESIEKSKTAKTIAREDPVPDDFWGNGEESINTTHDKCEEQKTAMIMDEEENSTDFWADHNENDNNNQSNSNSNYRTPDFDPTKYPEEPREVDTDEEIDFWAEIEAKNNNNDDDEITFHKSATFWARQDRQNSVEETPYKPVEQKAFSAKLPDEPSVDIDIWAAMEAARGEEPVLVDPVVEEETALAEVFNAMNYQENEESRDDDREDVGSEIASVHEPVVANIWSQKTQDASYTIEQEEQVEVEVEEVDFWADLEKEREKKKETEEAEQKRNNYRKAMAFFSTSIDDHKEQSVDKYNREGSTSNRASVIYENKDEEYCSPDNWPEREDLQHIDLGPPGSFEIVGEEENNVEDVDESSSESNSTPTNFETKLPEIYVEPKANLNRLPNGLPDLEVDKFNEERKVSVRQRINAFELGSPMELDKPKSLTTQSLSVESYTPQSSLSRNSSTQRSESEMEEDDSGVTDMNRQMSETDTESESFPELRKMTSYQRAATHSRLFKLLHDENDVPEGEDQGKADEFQLKPSRRKIVHNVSITRLQNPKALAEAETMTERRERLSLPLQKNISIDADNPSTPNSPASPIMGQSNAQRNAVSDKLVNELVQSLLLKSDSTHLRHLPMSRLQAAAKRALEEEMDSLESTSVETTPAPTPKQDKAYTDYYNTWSEASGHEEVMPSNTFRALQDSNSGRRSPWTVRCPRVLSSKTINRDLARVTESPEITARSSKSPECFRTSRERSLSRWRKV